MPFLILYGRISMILILTTSINICLLCVVIYLAFRMRKEKDEYMGKTLQIADSFYGRQEYDMNEMRKLIKEVRGAEHGYIRSAIKGEIDQYTIIAKVAQKMADRAFNMASSATIGVVALQRSLAIPKPVTKQQGLQNKLASEQVDALFKDEWLRATMSPEEIDLLEKSLDHRNKFMNHKDPTT